MAQPTAGDVHVNTPLTQMSVAFMQQADNFIADKVFPTLPVVHQSDRYYIYKRENWYRAVARERAPGSESAGGGWELDNTQSYFAKVLAVHKDVDDQIRANQDPVLNMDRDATRWVTQQLMLKRDIDWAAKFFALNIWSIDTTPSVLWSSSLSTPVEDIRNQYYSVFEKTGYKPNTLVLGARVFQALQDHPEFLDRIKYTQRGIVDTELLAAVFGVKRVLVAGAVQDLSEETLISSSLTQTYSFVMGKNALLVYTAEAPSLMEATGGYTFAWNGMFGAPTGMRIKRFRIEPNSADRIEGEMAYDMKVVAPDVGVFFSGAVA